MGNADSTVVDALFSCAKSCDTLARQKALCEHVKPLLLRIKSSWSDMDVDKLPDFCDVDSAAQVTASTDDASSASSLLLPRVIEYDKLGAPITFQDEVEITVDKTEEEFEWEDWVGLPQVKNAFCKEMAKTAVVTACLGLYLKELPTHSFKLTRNKD